MVNYDKNVHGAKRDAARKAHEEKVKAKQDKEDARKAAAKAKRDERNRQLLESIAEAIDESEEHAYGEVFHELCGDEELASVLDPQVLKFVADHSDISVQNGGERLADALRQVLCPGEEGLGLLEFLELLRENSVADGTAVAKFLETSQGNDALAATECAAHALHVAQKMVTMSFEKEKWDVLLQAVMKEHEKMVPLQDFVRICKRLARCARLLQYLEQEAQEELPVLHGKALQRWQALADDISARLQQQPGLRGPRNELPEPLEVIQEAAEKPREVVTGTKCDLCLAGICGYHGQLATAKGGALPRADAARRGLVEAVRSVGQLKMQLEDAILRAYDAGVPEDELLLAFQRLEELERCGG